MPDHCTDAEEQRLIEEAQHARDPQALERLYLLYMPRVYAYVSSRVQHRQSVEDLVADVLLKAVQALPTFHWQHAGSFGAWIFRIAHNTVLNYHRQQGVSEQWEWRVERVKGVKREGQGTHDEILAVPSEDPSPEEDLLRQERAEVIHRLLLALPRRRQEVITLRFFGELGNREIAAVLDLDERTVASHLCRGLSDLHALWLGEMEPENSAAPQQVQRGKSTPKIQGER